MHTALQIDDIFVKINIVRNGALRVYYTIYDGKDIIDNFFIFDKLFRYVLKLENMLGDFLHDFNMFSERSIYWKIKNSNHYSDFLYELDNFFNDYLKICCGL